MIGSTQMQQNSYGLQETLGYTFNDQSLLGLALTHRSHSSEHNERLEFLGDSVLNCAVSILLFEQYPDLDEGKLSRVRSHLVKQDCLAHVGRQIKLDDHIRLGFGERKSSSVIKDSIIADALEAIFGAILIDSDFRSAKECVIRLIRPVIESTPLELMGKDPKTRLQEHLQANKLALPRYSVLVQGGSSASPEFVVVCEVEALVLSAEGQGHSRREAEQRAAEKLLSTLINDDGSRAKPDSRGAL